LDGGGAGGTAFLITAAHPLVAFPAGQGIGDLAPRGKSAQVGCQWTPVQGVGVLAIEGGDPDPSPGQQRGVQEFVGVRHTGHPVDGVGERDQCGSHRSKIVGKVIVRKFLQSAGELGG